MPAPQRRFANAGPLIVGIADGVETVIATTQPVSTAFPGCVFLVEFWASYGVTSGGTMSLDFIVRQSSLTGPASNIDVSIPALANGAGGGVAIAAVDQRAIDAASVLWVLTVTPTGGTVTIGGSVASVTVDVGGTPNVFS